MLHRLRTTVTNLSARLLRQGGRRIGWTAAIALHAIGLATTTLVVTRSGVDSTEFAARNSGDEVVIALDLRTTRARAQAVTEFMPEQPQADRMSPSADAVASDEIEALAPLAATDPYVEEQSALAALLASELDTSISDASNVASTMPFVHDESALARRMLTRVGARTTMPSSTRSGERASDHSAEAATGPTNSPGSGTANGGGSQEDATLPSGNSGASTASAVWTNVVLVSNPRPAYPQMSVRRREEGHVQCRLHVLADGSVGDVCVLTSSGFERLDRAAIDALMTWRFHAATKDGIAVSTHVEQVVTFQFAGS